MQRDKEAAAALMREKQRKGMYTSKNKEGESPRDGGRHAFRGRDHADSVCCATADEKRAAEAKK